MRKGWERKTLKEIAEYTIGLTYSPSDVSEEGMIVLRSSNIQNSKIDLSDLVRVTKVVKPKLIVKTGDILMCSRNGSARLVGKTAVIPELDEEMTFGTFMTVVRSPFNPFLSYFFASDEFRKQITRGENPSIKQVTQYMLDDVEINLPPLPEQQQIVSVLDEAFESIAQAKSNAQRNLVNARELFDSFLQGIKAEKEPLGNLVDIKTGKLNANAAVEDGKYPFFTCAREVYAIDKYAFDCEAILLAGNNASGDFNVKHYKGKFNAYQRTYVITVNEKNQVLYKWLYYQLLNSLKEFKKQSVGANTKFLKLGMIQNMQILLPSLAEQRAIVGRLEALSAETGRLEEIYWQKIESLEELKKSVLSEAFSGEL